MAYRPAQMDIGAILNAGKAVSGSLGSIRENELANAKMAEEQRRYDEQRAWKLEDRERVAKERQAEDAYYGELAKGVQTKGSIYGDALATEASKYALNPEEILKAALYKNDAEQARAAGDTAIADKLDWQTKVSEGVSPFMQSGVGEESRSEMYDRINSKVGSQGLPIPKEAIISADQARLAERTAEEAELKRLKEAKADILKNDQTNAWKYVNSLGNNSTVLDVDGNEVQVQGPSASVQNRSNTSFNKAVDDGLTDILKTIEDKAKGTDVTSKAVVSDQALNLYTTLIRDQGISPDVASKLVSSGVGSSESGWKELWLGDPKAKLTKDQISTLLPSAMAAMELKKDLVGGTTTKSKGTDKQEASANLISALNMQNKSQLGSILSEQANLARGAEGRRDDRVTAWLQDQGLVDRPKAVESSNVGPIITNGGETRADRNNNPGNLTGNDKWQGMVGKDGRFVQFQTYELGSRALAKNLINGAVGKTVEDYMNKYAPKSENDTNSYIKNVSKALGKEPGSVITDKDILPLMKVIAKQEGGKVDEKGLEAGYKMATEFSGKGFDTKNSESSAVKDLFSKVDTTTSVQKTPTATESKASSFLKDENSMQAVRDTINSGPLGKKRAVTELTNQGFSDSDIKSILSYDAEKKRSDYLIADRNYRVAKRTGEKYAGKTAEEWDELRSTKNHIGDYGWAAPIVAASGPLAGLLSVLSGGGATTTTGSLLGEGFTTNVTREVGKKTTAELAKLAKDKALQEEISSLVGNNLNPASIKRLLDISAGNSKFSPAIREFLKTKGF